MKNILILSCALLGASFGVAPAGAEDQTVTQASVSLEDCRRLEARRARADVAYKPGVDVRGKAVTPADLEPPLGAIKLPDEIVIDFGLDLAGRYGIPGGGLYTATAGILTINYDLAAGGLTINGKPLTKDDERTIAKACRMMLDQAPDEAPDQAKDTSRDGLP